MLLTYTFIKMVGKTVCKEEKKGADQQFMHFFIYVSFVITKLRKIIFSTRKLRCS